MKYVLLEKRLTLFVSVPAYDHKHPSHDSPEEIKNNTTIVCLNVTRRNVALIILDTLQKDVFNDQFGWLSGVRCENAWNTSHCTTPAHAFLFIGVYPSKVGAHAKHKQLREYRQTLRLKNCRRADTRRSGTLPTRTSPATGRSTVDSIGYTSASQPAAC